MLQKPEDYDRAESFGSDYERLPAGGYVCEIKKAEERVIPKTGRVLVTVSFDIEEGEYRDFYARLYRRQKMRETLGGKPARWLGTYSVFPYTAGDSQIRDSRDCWNVWKSRMRGSGLSGR